MKLFRWSIRATDICNILRPDFLRGSNLTLQGSLWLTLLVQQTYMCTSITPEHNLLATLVHKQRPLATMSVVLIDSRHSRGIDPKPGLVGTGYVELALGPQRVCPTHAGGTARVFYAVPAACWILATRPTTQNNRPTKVASRQDYRRGKTTPL